MNKKHRSTLRKIFTKPLSANIHFKDIEALLVALGAKISEREGSRISVFLFGQVRIFHRPHPEPTTDKGALQTIRKWLEDNGVKHE